MLTAPPIEPPAIVQHVLSSNSIWDPNLLANPPVLTITTTGTSTCVYPVRWYDVNGNPIDVPYWVGDFPAAQPLIVPFIQGPEPVPYGPSPLSQTLDIQKLIEAMQNGALNAKPPEPPAEPEESKPVVKKYGRVLEP